MDLFDIVFEKRNKEYGAYYLHKKYVRYLAVSFSIILFIVLLFTGYALAYKFYSLKPVPLPKGVLYEPTYLSEEDFQVPELPELEPEVEPEPDELTENIVIEDSVKNVAQKVEEKTPPKEESNESQDSSSAGGPVGFENGDITVPIERMPQFPGGEKALVSYLQRNIQSNLRPTIKKAKGIVVISFVVKRDGSVGNVKVVRSLTPELDQICLKVVNSMPFWKPAISGGRPIEIIHNLPITF